MTAVADRTSTNPHINMIEPHDCRRPAPPPCVASASNCAATVRGSSAGAGDAADDRFGRPPPAPAKSEKNGKKRRSRRPKARPLRAIERLKNEEDGSPPVSPAAHEVK